MKKYLFLLGLSLSVQTINAQTKQELLHKIDKDIRSIEKLLNMSGMRIEITSGDPKPFDPNDGFNFEQFSMAKTAADREKLQEFFRQLPVHNQLLYPYNIITIGKKEFDLLKLIGKDNFYFSHQPDKEPVFTPTRITFLDGSSISKDLPVSSKKSIAEKYTKTEKEAGETYSYVDEEDMNDLEKMIWNSSSFDATIALADPKPIKSIRCNIELPVPVKKIYEAQGKTINTPYGTITIDTIAGTQVYCTIPDMDQDDDLQIEAYYKNGKVLRQRGSSSNTFISGNKKQVYRQWLSTLKQAKKDIDKGDIKSDSDLEAYLKAHAATTEEETQQAYKSSVYTFSGPVSKVVFILTDSSAKKESFEFTFDIYGADTDRETFVATDFESQKNGLLNKAGKWIVPAQFNLHFRPLNRYYYWDQFDEAENTYYYNPAAQTIQMVAYKIDDPEIYDDKYVKITPRTNGLKGLADVRSGKIILPMEYEHLSFKSNKYWLLKQEDNQGVLDQNFKTIMPIAYSKLDIEGDYIIAGGSGSNSDVYNAGGKNITQGKYDDIEGSFSDGLLLVGKRHISKEGYTSTKYYYIDTLCQVKIDLATKGYKDAAEFSAGMAVVKNEAGDYGYINTKGVLVLPFQYKYARSFYLTSKLALVTLKDGSYALIDKSGNLVKKLPGSFTKSKFKAADRASRILMEDKRSFNEYGEELEYNSNDYW
ncbi:MAG: WG repeat-containing protein [Sphingobacteriales bacterium]|nr:MAG: WG repeat-containing protein [Sphingobacteriales bacterium]